MYHVRKTFSLLYFVSCMQVEEAGKVSHFAAATVEQLLESSAFEGMALRTEKAKVRCIVEMPFPMAHREKLMLFMFLYIYFRRCESQSRDFRSSTFMFQLIKRRLLEKILLYRGG